MPEKKMEAVIPVYHPGEDLVRLLKRLDRQQYPLARIHLMHTDDGTALPELPEISVPVEIHPLKPQEFDHAGTRADGFALCESDYILCMTQDALPADDRLTATLADAFKSETCGMAYARQIARPEHGDIERYTRCFNYPPQDREQNLSRLDELGIKTYFCSDVCALYRRDLYEELGGFEQPAIFNEDTVFAYKLVQAGYSVCYRAEAKVIHSHCYSASQQFRRYFDLGVSQAQHPEIFKAVSSVSEGGKLVSGTARYLLRHGKIGALVQLVILSGAKWTGMQLGRRYRRLPDGLIRHFTMNRFYWERR